MSDQSSIPPILNTDQTRVAAAFRKIAWRLQHLIVGAATREADAPLEAWQAIADMVTAMALPGVQAVRVEHPEGPIASVLIEFPPFVHPSPVPGFPDALTPSAPIQIGLHVSEDIFAVNIYSDPGSQYSSAGYVTVTLNLANVPLMLPTLVAMYINQLGLGDPVGAQGRLATPEEAARLNPGAHEHAETAEQARAAGAGHGVGGEVWD